MTYCLKLAFINEGQLTDDAAVTMSTGSFPWAINCNVNINYH